MNEETTEQQFPEKNEILKAIADLAKRLDNFERNTNSQFEAIRQGIVSNSAAFDRLEATVYNSRSDVANLRADVKELSEEIRKNSIKTLV